MTTLLVLFTLIATIGVGIALYRCDMVVLPGPEGPEAMPRVMANSTDSLDNSECVNSPECVDRAVDGLVAVSSCSVLCGDPLSSPRFVQNFESPLCASACAGQATASLVPSVGVEPAPLADRDHPADAHTGQGIALHARVV